MKFKLLTEAFTLEGKVLQIFKDYKAFTKNTERGYILKDGSIVDNRTFIKNAGGTEEQLKYCRHLDVNNLLCSIMWPKEEKRDRKRDGRGLDDSGDPMTQLCDQFGYIRVNSSSEDYICLPDARPTSMQYSTLTEWIDDFFSKKRILGVMNSDGYQVEFDSKNSPAGVDYIDGKYVVDRIKRYYITGALTESKGENE